MIFGQVQGVPAIIAAELDTAIRDGETPLGEYFGAVTYDAFEHSLPGAMYQSTLVPEDDRISANPYGGRFAAMAWKPSGVPILTEDQWKSSPWYREGIPYDGRITQARAEAKAEIYDGDQYRARLRQNRVWGVGTVAALVAGSVIGSAPDPVNYIPVFGSAFKVANATRIGAMMTRAGVGTLDAGLLTSVEEPLIASSRRQFGEDVSFADQLTDIALGALTGGIGGAIHGGFERLGDRHPEHVSTALQTLGEAADAVANDRPIDVADSYRQSVLFPAGLGPTSDGAPELRQNTVWRLGDPWPDDIKDAQLAARAIPKTIGIATPERQQLRIDVADALYGTGAGEKGREAMIILGPPASGKSTIAVPLATRYRALLIDSDAAKERLPEYGGGIGATAVHDESDMIATGVVRRAMRAGDNLVLPVVGKTLDNARAKLKVLKEAGYRVHLVLTDLPIEKAVNRAMGRFRDAKEGRFVDPEYVLSVGDQPVQTYEVLKAEADSYARYSNDVPRGSPPRLVEESGGERSGGEESGRGQEPAGGGPGADIRGSRRDHGQDPARGNAPGAGGDQGAAGPTLVAGGARGDHGQIRDRGAAESGAGAGRRAGQGHRQSLGGPPQGSTKTGPTERQADTSADGASVGEHRSRADVRLRDLTAEQGVYSESDDSAQLGDVQQLRQAGQLTKAEQDALNEAEAAVKRADEYARAYEAAGRLPEKP